MDSGIPVEHFHSLLPAGSDPSGVVSPLVTGSSPVPPVSVATAVLPPHPELEREGAILLSASGSKLHSLLWDPVPTSSASSSSSSTSFELNANNYINSINPDSHGPWCSSSWSVPNAPNGSSITALAAETMALPLHSLSHCSNCLRHKHILSPVYSPDTTSAAHSNYSNTLLSNNDHQSSSQPSSRTSPMTQSPRALSSNTTKTTTTTTPRKNLDNSSSLPLSSSPTSTSSSSVLSNTIQTPPPTTTTTTTTNTTTNPIPTDASNAIPPAQTISHKIIAVAMVVDTTPPPGSAAEQALLPESVSEMSITSPPGSSILTTPSMMPSQYLPPTAKATPHPTPNPIPVTSRDSTPSSAASTPPMPPSGDTRTTAVSSSSTSPTSSTIPTSLSLAASAELPYTPQLAYPPSAKIASLGPDVSSSSTTTTSSSSPRAGASVVITGLPPLRTRREPEPITTPGLSLSRKKASGVSRRASVTTNFSPMMSGGFDPASTDDNDDHLSSRPIRPVRKRNARTNDSSPISSGAPTPPLKSVARRSTLSSVHGSPRSVAMSSSVTGSRPQTTPSVPDQAADLLNLTAQAQYPLSRRRSRRRFKSSPSSERHSSRGSARGHITTPSPLGSIASPIPTVEAPSPSLQSQLKKILADPSAPTPLPYNDHTDSFSSYSSDQEGIQDSDCSICSLSSACPGCSSYYSSSDYSDDSDANDSRSRSRRSGSSLRRARVAGLMRPPWYPNSPSVAAPSDGGVQVISLNPGFVPTAMRFIWSDGLDNLTLPSGPSVMEDPAAALEALRVHARATRDFMDPDTRPTPILLIAGASGTVVAWRWSVATRRFVPAYSGLSSALGRPATSKNPDKGETPQDTLSAFANPGSLRSSPLTTHRSAFANPASTSLPTTRNRSGSAVSSPMHQTAKISAPAGAPNPAVHSDKDDERKAGTGTPHDVPGLDIRGGESGEVTPQFSARDTRLSPRQPALLYPDSLWNEHVSGSKSSTPDVGFVSELANLAGSPTISVSVKYIGPCGARWMAFGSASGFIAVTKWLPGKTKTTVLSASARFDGPITCLEFFHRRSDGPASTVSSIVRTLATHSSPLTSDESGTGGVPPSRPVPSVSLEDESGEDDSDPLCLLVGAAMGMAVVFEDLNRLARWVHAEDYEPGHVGGLGDPVVLPGSTQDAVLAVAAQDVDADGAVELFVGLHSAKMLIYRCLPNQYQCIGSVMLPHPVRSIWPSVDVYGTGDMKTVVGTEFGLFVLAQPGKQ